jgi:hypothetical protein
LKIGQGTSKPLNYRQHNLPLAGQSDAARHKNTMHQHIVVDIVQTLKETAPSNYTIAVGGVYRRSVEQVGDSQHVQKQRKAMNFAWMRQSIKRSPTNGRDERGVEGIIGKPKKHTCLSNSTVSNKEQLEQVVVCFGRHAALWSEDESPQKESQTVSEPSRCRGHLSAPQYHGGFGTRVGMQLSKSKRVV